MSTEALNTYLSPISDLLDNESVNEIIVNRPHEVLVEIDHRFRKEAREALSFEHLRTIAELVATHTHQVIDDRHPLLSATLPNGNRVQFVIPPACPSGVVIMVVRRQRLLELTLEDYLNMGSFEYTNSDLVTQRSAFSALYELYENGRYYDFICSLVKNRINFIVSGGTSTGKTTFINACLSSIPENERLVIIEDAQEVLPAHQNVSRLLYSRGKQGLSEIGAQDLLEASLRLRPDRIVLGELRGSEAYSYLRAINSGHDGSVSSVHADTPQRAYDQIALMVMQAGMGLNKAEIIEYVKGIVPVVLQWKRVNNKHLLTEIHIEQHR